MSHNLRVHWAEIWRCPRTPTKFQRSRSTWLDCSINLGSPNAQYLLLIEIKLSIATRHYGGPLNNPRYTNSQLLNLRQLLPPFLWFAGKFTLRQLFHKELSAGYWTSPYLPFTRSIAILNLSLFLRQKRMNSSPDVNCDPLKEPSFITSQWSVPNPWPGNTTTFTTNRGRMGFFYYLSNFWASVGCTWPGVQIHSLIVRNRGFIASKGSTWYQNFTAISEVRSLIKLQSFL